MLSAWMAGAWIVCAVARMCAAAPEAALDGEGEAFRQMELLARAMALIRKDYIDAGRIEYRDLVENALAGMLAGLDEHSQYLGPDTFREMKEDTEGTFEGVGVVIGVKDGVITVIAPIEDTPAFRAGILPGDRIVGIDGLDTREAPLEQAVDRLRGEKGTKVTIRVYRPHTGETKDVEIMRDTVNVSSVKGSRMMGGGVGYVRITQFNMPTADALQTALQDLLGRGMEGLILDLRDNPGGLLRAAIEVSQKFLEPNALIVFTKGRATEDGMPPRAVAMGQHHYVNMPIAILVNSNSASASEIVAGALQDHRRAVLVGQRTYGKGSVQSILPLDEQEEHALRLTTAMYFTPSQRVIHGHGIEPDVRVDVGPSEWERVRIWRMQQENPDAYTEKDKREYIGVRDRQLDRAWDVVRGVLILRGQGAGGAGGARAGPELQRR